MKFAVRGRRHAVSFFEVENETAVVVETQDSRDLGHSAIGLPEQIGGAVHLYFSDVLVWREAKVGFEEGAQPGL